MILTESSLTYSNLNPCGSKACCNEIEEKEVIASGKERSSGVSIINQTSSFRDSDRTNSNNQLSIVIRVADSSRSGRMGTLGESGQIEAETDWRGGGHAVCSTETICGRRDGGCGRDTDESMVQGYCVFYSDQLRMRRTEDLCEWSELPPATRRFMDFPKAEIRI